MDRVTTVFIENQGPALAFGVRLKVTKGPDGDEVLPVLWEDNYFALLPGERRTVTATYRARIWAAPRHQCKPKPGTKSSCGARTPACGGPTRVNAFRFGG